MSPAPDALAAAGIAVGLGAARTLPLLWWVAPLGGSRLPVAARLGLALLLAGLCAPALQAAAARAGVDRAGPALLLALLVREGVVGAVLGFVASMIFRAAEVAGHLSDSLRGANVAEVLSPTTAERSSPLGALYVLLATLVFIEVGGVPRLLQALASSYDAIPLGVPLHAAGVNRVAVVVILASARLLESALALAAPVVVAMWLTDVALGLVARLMPQIPVYFIGLPLKGLLGVGVVLMGLGALHGALARGVQAWVTLVDHAAAAL